MAQAIWPVTNLGKYIIGNPDCKQNLSPTSTTLFQALMRPASGPGAWLVTRLTE